MAGLTAFHLYGATLVGREHVRTGRNNQDGLAVLRHPGLLAAAVTDGCSAGHHSEVGAKLAAAWLVQQAPRYRTRFDRLDAPELPEAIAQGLQRYLKGLIRPLTGGVTGMAAAIHEFALFTFLLALIDADTALVLGLGDGVVAVNGDVRTLEAGAGNAPPYLAYRLLDPAAVNGVGDLRPVVHYLGPTEDVQTLLIATDGAAELEAKAAVALADGRPSGGLRALATDPRYRQNPSLLQKRLNVIGGLNRQLHDDTTLVLIQQEEAGPCGC